MNDLDLITSETSNHGGLVFEKTESLTYFERDAGSFPMAITVNDEILAK